MGPRGALIIMVLLIASKRNSTQVRLGKIRALLEGIQRPQETDWNITRTVFVSASVCQHHFLPLHTDFFLPGNEVATALGSTSSLLCLPLILFQKVPKKDSH